jgi:hypothetical protein
MRGTNRLLLISSFTFSMGTVADRTKVVVVFVFVVPALMVG